MTTDPAPHDPTTTRPTTRDPTTHDRGPHLVVAATAGIAAAVAGLGAAELVASTSTALQSPVLDVGDRVVDGVPTAVKDLAIAWFGTGDKVALLIGIGSIMTVAAAGAGILTLRRRPAIALVGVALFTILGIIASQTSRRGAPPAAVIPTLVGGVIVAATLVALQRLDRRPDLRSPDAPDTTPIARRIPNDRRRFLAAVAVVATAGAIAGATGRRIATSAGAAASRAGLALPGVRRPLPDPSGGVMAPVADVTPFFTPNAEFYRIDTALTIPQVTAEDWELTVHGRVEQPLRLRYVDLLEGDLVESDITLVCVSNEIGGNLLGTARWTGIRLDRLLTDAGVDPTADQVVGRSVDGYTCGFPIRALDGRDALVAIGMNGEPLPLRHGFPARLIVPGLYGYVSATKWLSEIELTRFDEFDQYWVRRGWVDDAPIKVQSRIDTPRGLQRLASGTVPIAGVAWAPTRGIERVEVRVDEGDWIDADLAEEWNDTTWRQWSHPWEATDGRHTIEVRATERDGPIQPSERSEPFPSGATGHHRIVVLVE